MRIGIDLGGTSIKAALCTDRGELLHKASAPTRTGDPDGLRADMQQLALILCKTQQISPDEIDSIGIGVPGSLDKAGCRLIFGTNLGMENVCFADAFTPTFSCPVQLDNDANCAALGEATAGAGRGVPNMIMLTLGTGVGGGIVIDGRLYAGCNDIGGELGHMVIRQGGELCGCGRRGCFEAYCSAAHFVKFAARALDEGKKSSLAAHRAQLDAKRICDAVDAGDDLACALFEEYCDNLACGLANIINIFQPDRLVIGGGLSGYGEKLLKPLRARTAPQTFRCETTNTEIVAATLGNDAGLIGAAML